MSPGTRHRVAILAAAGSGLSYVLAAIVIALAR